MFVSVSLLSFAFDKAKSGEILSEWLAAAGYNNYSQTARLVGMTDDMLYNVLSGRNKEISLDRVFKLCTLTGHTVDEFVNRLLNGMDTDNYADDFYDYNGYKDDGVLLFISMSTSEMYISTKGRGTDYITDYGIDYIFGQISDDLSSDRSHMLPRR